MSSIVDRNVSFMGLELRREVRSGERFESLAYGRRQSHGDE